MNRLVRIAAVAGPALLAVVAASGVALAAARFDHATPGPEQVLNVSPARVDIYTVRFTSPDPLGTQAIVLDRNQARVDVGDTVVDPADHHHFWVDLQPNLPAGRYVVSFKTLGEADLDYDGGAYAFYVGTQPTKADLAADKTLSLTTLDDPSVLTGYTRGAIEGGLTLVVALPACYYIWRRRNRHYRSDTPEDLVLRDVQEQ